jgi:membrane-bound lytic murein transglycosylase F
MLFSLGTLAALLLLAEADAGNGPDLPAIRERGVLRVLVVDDRPAAAASEVVSLKPGAPRGFDGEIVEAFAALQRLKLEFVPVTSGGERIPAPLAGKGDMVIGLVATEARRKQVSFTVEVFPTRHVTVTHKPHPPITTLEELRRARVGTTKGSSWAETLAAVKLPRENIDDSFVTGAEALEALRQKRITAIVMDVSGALLAKQRDPEMELGLFLGPLGSAAWAVRPDAPQLREALDEYITNVRRTPTWSRLVVKYYGDVALEVLQKSRANP